MDVHGAGAQRSDPKTGDSAEFPTYFGPQGDVRRMENYVRCVRSGVDDGIITGGEVNETKAGAGNPQGGGQGQPGQQGQQQSRGPRQGDNKGGGRPLIDLASAAAQLGVSEQALHDALGDPGQGPPDLAAAAAILGVSEQELIAALGVPAGGPP
jgi:hypothetical protein